jgi:hypothetical protein
MVFVDEAFGRNQVSMQMWAESNVGISALTRDTLSLFPVRTA